MRRTFISGSTRLGEELAGVGAGRRGDLLGRAGGDHLAALLAALGAEVDDPVGGLDHVEVVLDHDHRVAGVDQAVEHVEQPLDVGEVQAGGRLVEDVERVAGRDLGELGRELDPLRLAAGELRRRLAEADVVEPDVVQRLAGGARSSGCSRRTRHASSTDISSTSAIDLPLKRTSSVSRL